MPYRKILLATNQVYHVYNRGVAGSQIFSLTKDYLRFIDLINYYRFCDVPTSFSQFSKIPHEERQKILDEIMNKNRPAVLVLVFCLMPNHFHLLLKQVSADGISKFMSKLQNGYVKYFNIRGERAGPLFQSIFKAVRVENDEQLLHVSRYIHLNPSTGYLVEPKKLLDYQWSSLPVYLNSKAHSLTYPFVNSDFILDFFKKNSNYNASLQERSNYKDFVFDQAEHQRQLDKIKHLTLE